MVELRVAVSTYTWRMY